tara:strand:+ start:2258 stop:3667 length:1410 start_codon:yes stop_codon:yes gene_type:complete
MKIKNICCIGAGYVGGPTMAVISQKCPFIKVNVVDKDSNKIDKWNSTNLNELPVYEPGLSEIIKNVRGKNLFFSNDIEKAVKNADMIFLAVNTPTKSYGEGKGMAVDLKYVENSARLIAKFSKSPKIVVEKSTLPVRTAEAIEKILKSENPSVKFEVISNPEFLAEGTAIKDLFKSDRVLIGGHKSKSGQKAVNSLVKIYNNWIPNDKIVTTNLWSSELAKLVSNAFLSQRISSINSISALCEATGADVDEVSRAVGKDKRIGSEFLKASVGFGGSCFQKDILSLVYLCQHYNLNEVANYWESVIKINNYQRERFSKKIIQTLFGSVTEKTVTILGWAFKKNTNDSRESSSIYISSKLIENGADIKVYDPKVSKKRILEDLKENWKNKGFQKENIKENITKIKILPNPTEACENSSAICIITEWEEFVNLNWKIIYKNMKRPAFLFDGRNILSKDKLKKIGFEIYQIGK